RRFSPDRCCRAHRTTNVSVPTFTVPIAGAFLIASSSAAYPPLFNVASIASRSGSGEYLSLWRSTYAAPARPASLAAFACARNVSGAVGRRTAPGFWGTRKANMINAIVDEDAISDMGDTPESNRLYSVTASRSRAHHMW